MSEGELYNTNELSNGQLHFTATFVKNSANDELEQTLEIPIYGKESIKLPFTFMPPTANDKMTKTGTPSIDLDGTRVIDWVIWVNRKGENLSEAQVNDMTDGKHELYGNITIEKYKVGLNGVENSPMNTTTMTQFPVNLEDGRHAYKLTYQTKVIEEPIDAEETYINTAILTGNHNDSATSSAEHKYGTKLEKEVIDEDKYRAKWGIKFNYFGKQLGNDVKLIDTIIGPHKIDADSVKVFLVTFDAQGNPTVASNPMNQIPSYKVEEEKKLTIDLNSTNGEAYYIEYETIHEKYFVTQGSSISNEAWYKDGEIEIKDNASFDFSENIFSKSRKSIDFNKKEITWTLHVNAEREMRNFVITDTFTNYGEEQGGTRQTLIDSAGNAVISDNVKSAFIISNGVTPTNVSLNSNATSGFKLEFENVTESFTITYKTKFDLLPNGAAYNEYKNTAIATWEHPTNDESFSITKTADYTPGSTSPTGKNGYKEGYFDHVEQKFNWKLAVNINKQNIKGATVVDEIGDGHVLVPSSIKVYKLNLNIDQEKGTYNEQDLIENSNIFTITSDSDNKGFTLMFNENLDDRDNNEAYIIIYQTEDEDEIIGHLGGGTYGNTAEFTTKSGGTGKFNFQASAIVEHANELIKKRVTMNPSEETITWTIDVNKSHSLLGNIILTDTMSNNQLILPETFEKREIKMDQVGNISYGSWKPAPPTTIDNEVNIFTLNLDELNQKGYQIRYKTFFLGADGDTFSNEATINYTEHTAGASTSDKKDNQVFKYSASSGTISSTKGNIEIHKVGVNPLTGEQENLSGIKFELRNLTGSIKLAEGTTNTDGKLTFENVRYGKYQLKEINTPEGYRPLNPNTIEITLNETLDKNVGGKTYIVENFKDVDLTNACPNFTLTINDVNQKPNSHHRVKLVNKNTGAEVTQSTDSNGQISVGRGNLLAGSYELFEESSSGWIKLDDVTVNYDGNCEAKVIQPEPQCLNFTVEIQDEKGNPRTDLSKVTLKHNGTEKEFPVTNGQFKVPYDMVKNGEMETGVTYSVYENKQFLTTVEISYKNSCDTVIKKQAAKCEIFTLIVKDVDGNLRSNEQVKITVKNKETSTTQTVDVTTNEEGKVTFTNLEPGEYAVYEDGKEEPFASFTSNPSCSTDVQPKPACENYTLTVLDVDGKPFEDDTTIILVKPGTPITEGVSSPVKDGKATYATDKLPAGKYDVYEGETKIGETTVSYKESCTNEFKQLPQCTNFTLFVTDKNGKHFAKGKTITLKNQEGKVFTGETDENSRVAYKSEQLPAGEYTVSHDDKELGKITVSYKDNCGASLVHFPLKDEDGEDNLLKKIIEDPNKKRIKIKRKDKEVPIDEDGGISTDEFEPGEELTVVIEVEVEDEDGNIVIKEIIIGKIPIDENGNPKEFELVDPYGKITDKDTGEPIEDVKVTLYYCGTSGSEIVTLPYLDWFGPNNNVNPQYSKKETWNNEAQDFAMYAWMVYPNETYCIHAEKPGYEPYDSSEISVGYDIVKHDIEMKKRSGFGGGGSSQPELKDPTKPLDPKDPKDPKEPKDPIDQQDEQDGNNPTTPSNNGTPNNDDTDDAEGVSDKNKTDQTGSPTIGGDQKGNKLPQTGEAYNVKLLVGGIISILFGISLLLFRRKEKTL